MAVKPKFYDEDAPYGRSGKGTALRADGAPANYAGSYESYLASKATEAQRGQANREWNTGAGGRITVAKETGVDLGKRPAGVNGGSAADYAASNGIAGSVEQSAYERQLAQARRSAEEAQRLAMEQGAGRLAAQKPTVNQTYDEIAKQAYANYRLQQKRLPEQNANLSAGAADSLMLRGTLGYENNLSQSERERANALTGIDNDVANLRATGEIGIAQNAEKYALMAAQAKQQAEQQAYERMMADRQLADRQRQEDFSNNLALRQLVMKAKNDKDGDSYSRSKQLADALAAIGDYSGYLALGWTRAQVEQAQAQYQQMLEKEGYTAPSQTDSPDLGYQVYGGAAPQSGGGSFLASELGQTLSQFGTAEAKINYLMGLLNNGAITQEQYNQYKNSIYGG